MRKLLPLLIIVNLLTSDLVGRDIELMQRERLRSLYSESIDRQGGEFFRVNFTNGLVKHLTGRFSNDIRSDFRSQAVQFLNENNILFGFRGIQSDFIITNETFDNFGMHHITFQQTYQGVPVLHHQIKMHTDIEGRLTAVSNNYFPGIAISIIPNLTKQEAGEYAKQAFGDIQANIKPAKLIIYTENDVPVLAYKLDMASAIDKAYTIIIDATNGSVLKTYSLVHPQATYGSGLNLLGEVVDSLNIYQGSDFGWDNIQDYIDAVNNRWDYPDYIPVTGNYNLVDESDTTQGRIFTLTASNSAFYEIDFVSSLFDTFSSTIDSLSHASGVTAHDFHRKSVDYYHDQHGRIGWLSPGYRVIALVDYGPNDQISVFNAYYSGFYGSVNYGIGGGNTLPFCAALDVVAHELTHGVTRQSSGLIYENMPGALNESMSDVFGYLVEAEFHDGGDWLMGEDLYLTGGYIRDMQNPPNAGDPDHFSNATFADEPTSDNDYGGVHSNSGIPNKVFYLLVQGDMHYGVDVPPFDPDIDISRGIAANIWYIWNTQYLNAIDDFHIGREKMLQVSSSLYPGNQDYYAAIQKAWGSVGVQPGAILDLSDTFLAPGSGSVNLQSTFQNSYAGYDIAAEVVSQTTTAMDTTTLYDDGAHGDESAGDQIWGGSWIVGQSEDFFNLNLLVSDTASGLTDLYFNMAHFTTAGPVVFDTLTFLIPAGGEPVPGDQIIVTLHLRNNGATLTLPAISAQILPLDTLVTIVGPSTVFFGDIDPGQTVPQFNYFAGLISPEFPAMTAAHFKMIYYSGSEAYWSDTMSIQMHGTVANDPTGDVPIDFALYQNYPNPFNPETVIRYVLPEKSEVAIDIYNILGQTVRSFYSRTEESGFKSIRWDGNDFSGQAVGAGVYIYRIRAGEYTRSMKMLLLK